MQQTPMTAPKSTRLTRCRIQRLSASALLMAALVGTGCSHMVNPFADNMKPASEITTPSAERIRAAHAGRDKPRQRGWPPNVALRQDPCTYHWPLWFSGPFEDTGSTNGQFKWTLEDYFAMIYCPARQVVNLCALPVSVVVDPIWTLHCSDGYVSPQRFGFSNHDASPM